MVIKIEDGLIPRPKENLMIVDALNLAFRWKHQGKLNFRSDYINTVMSLAKSYNCGTIIIAADWGNSTFRKDLFPDYKQNRKDKFELQSTQEKEDFDLFFEEYEATLGELSVKNLVFRYKGVEADDIAAYLVKVHKEYNFENVWLISSDRDWDLLISDQVSRFSYVTRKEITVDTWPYEVTMEDYISYKCLTGDAGDNIPGIPGIGPKRAAQIIEQYGDALTIYHSCPIPGKYKYIDALNANKEQILINYELMDLVSFCEEAIGKDNVLDMRWRLDENRL